MLEGSLVGLYTAFVAGIAIRDKLVAPHRVELASVLVDVPWPASLAGAAGSVMLWWQETWDLPNLWLLLAVFPSIAAIGGFLLWLQPNRLDRDPERERRQAEALMRTLSAPRPPRRLADPHAQHAFQLKVGLILAGVSGSLFLGMLAWVRGLKGEQSFAGVGIVLVLFVLGVLALRGLLMAAVARFRMARLEEPAAPGADDPKTEG